jgi:hypothetical protein
MFIRYIRSGSDTGSIEVNGVPPAYLAVASSAVAAFSGSTASNTASVDLSALGAPWELASLHIVSGTVDGPLVEELTGSFISGNIFGGDMYSWSTRSIFAPDVSRSIIMVPLTMSFVGISVTTVAGGDGNGDGAGDDFTRIGQIYPRGTSIE